MSRRAFTLVELLVVVAIIGLLSSVAVVTMGSARDKARMASALQFESQTYRALGAEAVGTWSFDDATGSVASDGTGLGRNGTVVGATWSSDTPTGRGSSLSFDGVNDYVNLGMASNTEISQQVTFSAWVKNESNSAGGVISKGLVNSAEVTLGFGYSNPLLLIARGSHFSNQLIYPWTGALASGWHHVAMTVGPGGMRLYVDGKTVAQSTNTAIANNTEPFQIGYHGASYFLHGLIDDAKIYGSSLSAEQIRKFYAEGRASHSVAVVR